MTKFNEVNSWIKRINAGQVQKIFEEALSTYPTSFTIVQFRQLPSFKALNIGVYKSEFSSLLTQRFKGMGLIKNRNSKWFFTSQPVVLSTVEEIVEQMRQLENMLLDKRYSKTESAVFEKTEVVSLTI